MVITCLLNNFCRENVNNEKTSKRMKKLKKILEEYN